MTDPVDLETLIEWVRARSASDSKIDRLEAAVEVAGTVAGLQDALIDHFVNEARRAGCSWAEIGTRLGVTKQAAQQRFVRKWWPARARPFGRGPFARFTHPARRVVVEAQREARELNHNYIGTEHLLLGLLATDEGIGAAVLKSFDVDAAGVRAAVEAEIGRGDSSPMGHIPFTPRSKKVLELSLREALALGDKHIGTEHIFLALLREGKGVGATILKAAGVGYEDARREVQSRSGDAPGR
jgi:hypothetical protein